MKGILALVGTGSTLSLVGVGLMLTAAAFGLNDVLDLRPWLGFLIVGFTSLAIGAGAFYASKSQVEEAVEENLTVAGQARQLPWVTVGVAIVAGLILSRFIRWASRGSVVPTVPPPPPQPEPLPSNAVPIVTYKAASGRRETTERPVRSAQVYTAYGPPPPAPKPQERPLFGDLGTALRGFGQSALTSAMTLGAKTLGEKLLAQVFEGGPPQTTAAAGNHDRHRNGSHPSSGF